MKTRIDWRVVLLFSMICLHGSGPGTMLLAAAPVMPSVTATYEDGDIPTSFLSYSGSCNGPITTLSVSLPTGGPWQVTGMDIAYNMTAQGGGWKSHQRSYVRCQTTSVSESQTYEGTGDSGGVQAYDRTGVDIANGTYTGETELVFEMRTWRTSQIGGCNTTYNRVDNFTWTITVHYEEVPAEGSVGIGTAAPAGSALLELQSVQRGFLPPRMTTNLRSGIASPVAGLMVFDTDQDALFVHDGTNWTNLTTGPATPWTISGSNIYRLSGNIGIGLSAPQYAIDLEGQMRLVHEGATRPGIWFRNQANTFDRARFGMSRPDSTIGIWSQHLNKWAIEFEIMREPRIGINIPAGRPPRAEVHLYHTNFGGSNDGVRIQNEGPNEHYWNLYTSNTTGHFEFFKSGIKRATIDATSGAYTAVSDVRLKSDIRPMDIVLPDVMRLAPKTYRFTDFPDQGPFTGLIAQELEAVFPQYVYYGGDDQVTYTVDYGGLSVIAIKAIQEQQAQIDNLQQEVAALKAMLEQIIAAKRE